MQKAAGDASNCYHIPKIFRVFLLKNVQKDNE
jgi:hypothetical protein